MRKRIISLCICISLIFSILTGRIGYIIFSGNYNVLNGYNSYSVLIDNTELNLYYSNSNRINNNLYSYVAIIKPNEKCIGELIKAYSTNERKEIMQELKQGYPLVKSINPSKRKELKYIKIEKINRSQYPSKQLLSKECDGLLNHTSNIIGNKSISYNIDAKGRLLAGDDGKIINNNYNSNEGLKLSLNQDIQDIANQASSKLKNGCIVIMDINDSSILACVTKPNDSFTNKPLKQYAVGSIFKIVIACCALENKVDINYECKGSIKVGDTIYSCQKNKMHKNQSLKQALANSCNCYFVNLALELGSSKILKTAKSLGFDSTTNLYNDWLFNNAKLPTNNDLLSKGELALLGFGQGKLTATPIQMCNCLCSIANGGYNNESRLVLSTINKNGISESIAYSKGDKALSSNTCDKMMEYLRYVVTDGTGYNAESFNKKSAGKTATAQTGQYINGNEILNTWFAGIYPYDNPKYAIVILTENGTSGSEDCCPIFSTIVEMLDLMWYTKYILLRRHFYG